LAGRHVEVHVKVTLEPTSQLTVLNGVPCRVWVAVAEADVPEDEVAFFEADLQACAAPTVRWPARMVV